MSIENSYINNIDNNDSKLPEGMGFMAEDSIETIFSKAWPELDIRKSTKDEDSGLRQIVEGKKIDEIVYFEGKPVLSLQISTSGSSKVLSEKLKHLSAHPFVRLEEMKREDVSIPQALIILDPKLVQEYIKSEDDPTVISKLYEQIESDIIKSLTFDSQMTKNTDEINLIKTVMDIIKRKRAN